MRWSQVLLVAACIVVPGAALDAAGDEATTPDVQTLREAGLDSDGPALVSFLRKRTLLPGDEEKIAALVRQLGSPLYKMRNKASAALVARGSAALSALDRALHDPDLEVTRRAEQAVRQIKDKDTGPAVTTAAVRLLAIKKPAAAVETLLAFLPYAEDDYVAGEVRSVLAALAAPKGKPDKVLLAALSEKNAVKRAAAAEALCQAGLVKQLPALRKMLTDPNASVRLRVALALAGAREKQAIPVLIALLGEADRTQAHLAQDFLYGLAEDRAPTISPGTDAASRGRCRDAWAAWWDKHRSKIDLAKLSQKPRLLGYTVLLFLDLGKVVERDGAGKQRWEVEGLDLPLDVQFLPGKRLLVAEHGAGRVSERNRKGTILWQKKIAQPLMAQRLPNGNTFIGTRTELVEVDRAGKQVFTYTPRNGELFMRVQKLRNGELACVVMDEMGTGSRFMRLDGAGKQISSFSVNVSTYGGRIEVLPNGQVLVPEMHLNRVVLYDKTGKTVWNARVIQPVAAVRLANGHTLVTTYGQNRAIELDKDGEEVAEFKADTRVTRAWRR